MYLRKKEIISVVLGFLISMNTPKIFASDQEFSEEPKTKKANPLTSSSKDNIVFPDDFPKKPIVEVDVLTKIQDQAIRALSKDSVCLHRSSYCQESFTVFLEARNQILEEISKLKVYTIQLNEKPILKMKDPKTATYHYEILNVSKESIGQFWLTILEVGRDKTQNLSVPKLSESQKRQWTRYYAKLKTLITDKPTTLRGALVPYETIASLGRTVASQRTDLIQDEEILISDEKVLTLLSSSSATEEETPSKKVKKDASKSKKDKKKDKKSNVAISPTKQRLLGVSVKDIKKVKLSSSPPLSSGISPHTSPETRGRSFSFASPSTYSDEPTSANWKKLTSEGQTQSTKEDLKARAKSPLSPRKDKETKVTTKKSKSAEKEDYSSSSSQEISGITAKREMFEGRGRSASFSAPGTSKVLSSSKSQAPTLSSGDQINSIEDSSTQSE